jgi:hypothetical protein
LLLDVPEVHQVVCLGSRKAEVVRGLSRPLQVGDRVRQSVLGLRQGAEEGFGVVQRPLVTDGAEQAQSRVAGGFAAGCFTEGQLGPSGQ